MPQSQKSEEEEEGCETFLLNNSQLTLLKLLETRFVSIWCRAKSSLRQGAVCCVQGHTHLNYISRHSVLLTLKLHSMFLSPVFVVFVGESAK